MKGVIIISVIATLSWASAHILPASTSLLRTSSIPYTNQIIPTVYSQPLLAHYTSPFVQHGSVFAHQQPIFAQYPGLVQYPYPVAQNPVLQNPILQNPVIGQIPNIPAQGGPVIEPADPAGSPVVPLPPLPAPPQQSPILGGRPGSTTQDDDTVTIEAA
ncbi:uncharacterized protein LOC115877332 [Sitophilus oryzae]|uniref:Uncharacterized protein LOC115877332 n=1 Tax=Sitophilus oryzae TaxID=7048 RepID=A0A6J2XDD2_SITOR|nr:uncharacterized protein LOC115877332 [Sitophilus oryzae]